VDQLAAVRLALAACHREARQREREKQFGSRHQARRECCAASSLRIFPLHCLAKLSVAHPMNNTLEIMSDTPTTYNKEVRHRVGKRLLPSTDSENEDDPHIDSCPSSDEFSEITVGVAWSATNDRSELPVS